MSITFLKRSIWQRIFGICATPKPKNAGGWRYDSGRLIIQLKQIPELTQPGTAIRFEGDNLPHRVLVVFGENETYRAFQNRCSHIGHRRLDYVPGTETVQCCSVNKSTYTFDGDQIHGPTPEPIPTYSVNKVDDELHIQIT